MQMFIRGLVMNSWRRWLALICAMAVMAFAMGAGCAGGSTAAAPIVTPKFDFDRAFADLDKQLTFGFRVPGTAAHQKVQEWIVEQIKPSCATVTLQPFKDMLGGKEVQMNNIIGSIPGNGKAPREVVIVAAHWDSRPTADYDPDVKKRLTPIPAANDGASGVAVLIEIGRQLKANPISRDVLLVFFDGEDFGTYPDHDQDRNISKMLLGSKFYAKNLPKSKPSWGILLDMIGDKDLDIYREPNSNKYAKEVNDRVFAAAKEMGYMRTGKTSGFIDKPNSFAIVDDHIAINEAGVPMIDLIDFNYRPWHTTLDDITQVSPDSLKIVGNTVLYALQMP